MKDDCANCKHGVTAQYNPPCNTCTPEGWPNWEPVWPVADLLKEVTFAREQWESLSYGNFELPTVSKSDLIKMQDLTKAYKHLFNLFKSYTPDLPMSSGMAAEYRARYKAVELLQGEIE